jgi:hypothetical protein
VEIFKSILSLLESITNQPQLIETLPEGFSEKFTQFTKLSVSNHLARLESAGNFPVSQFLLLLLNYTMKQPLVDNYVDCLVK